MTFSLLRFQGLVDVAKEITKLESKKEKLNGQLGKLREAMETADYVTKVDLFSTKERHLLRGICFFCFSISLKRALSEVDLIQCVFCIERFFMPDTDIMDYLLFRDIKHYFFTFLFHYERFRANDGEVLLLTFAVFQNVSGAGECSTTEYRKGMVYLVFSVVISLI